MQKKQEHLDELGAVQFGPRVLVLVLVLMCLCCCSREPCGGSVVVLTRLSRPQEQILPHHSVFAGEQQEHDPDR